MDSPGDLQAELARLEPLIHSHLNGVKSPDIDSAISAFRARADVLQLCRVFLSTTKNDITVFFCSNVISDTILKRWNIIDSQEWAKLTTFLFEFISARNTMPVYARNALVKTVCLIGRFRWPHEDAHFFNNVMIFCGNTGTLSVGFQFLQTISQEFVSAADNLLSSQKAAIRNSLIGVLPLIFEFFESFLTQALQANCVPELVQASLKCLHNYLQWVPMSPGHAGYNPSIALLVWKQLPILFRIISVQSVLSQDAFSCLHEIVERGFTPPNMTDYLGFVFSEIQRLLTLWITSHELQKAENEDYFQNFTYFLASFIKNHMRKVIENPAFPLEHFAILLSQYSAGIRLTQSYQETLAYWTVILELMLGLRQTHMSLFTQGFKDSCTLLVRSSLHRIQYRSNEDGLTELDDEAILEEGVTELGLFVQSNIELVLLVSKIYDTESLEQIGRALFETANAYTAVIQGSETLGVDKLNSLCKDLVTLLQLTGGLSEMLTSNFVAFFPASNTIWDKLITLCALCFTECGGANRFQSNKICSQLMRTLQSFVPWLLQLYTQSIELQSQGSQEFINRLDLVMANLIDMCTSSIDPRIPSDVLQASLNLFLSISSNVRPYHTVLHPRVQNLVKDLVEVSRNLPLNNQRTLFCVAASITFGKPRYKAEELSHILDQFKQLFKQLLDRLIKQFSELSTQGNIQTLSNHEVSTEFQRSLHVLAAVLESIEPQPRNVKLFVCEALGPMLHPHITFLSVLPTNLSLYNDYLAMTLQFVNSIYGLLDPSYLNEMTRSLMGVFTNEAFVSLLANNSSLALEIINKYEDVMAVILQNPSSSAADAARNICDVIAASLVPLLNQITKATDERNKAYDLLRKAIITHWRTIASHDSLNTAISCFCQALAAPEPHVFKHILEIFASINKAHRLYHKEGFRTGLRNQLLGRLLMDLIQKNHNSVLDETLATIFEIASVDFTWFYQTFLLTFLRDIPGITESQKTGIFSTITLQTDAPSFNVLIQGFAGDCAGLLRLNSSV